MHRFLFSLVALGLFAGQAAAQEREWSLDASDTEAYLIFGVPDSDDVGVSLWCPIRKGIVNLFVPRPTEELASLGRGKVALTVKAGDESATFGGKVDINSEGSASSVEAEVPADHPLFKALETADRFIVEVEGKPVVFPLYNVDMSMLMGLCRKG